MNAQSDTGIQGQVEIQGQVDKALEAMRAGRADRAIQMLEPLSRRFPPDARVWQLLGFAYRDEQRMPEAVQAFAKAVECDPKDAKSALAYALARYESGLPAAQLCRQAVELAPDNLVAIGGCATALAAEDQKRAAENLLVDTLARRPDWLEGHAKLAALRWTAGDAEQFARSYVAACRKLPQHMPLRLAWFRQVAQARRWPDARAIIAEGERLFGPQPAFAIARLFVAAESGARMEAEALFAHTRDWRDEVRDLAWIRHCLREHRPAEAADTALALTRTPSSRLAWPYLSLIWRLLEDPRARWLDGSPPYVRAMEVDLTPGDLEEFAALLRRQHTAQAPYIEQSVRGGTQTDRPLFLRMEPVVQRVRSCLRDAVRAYVAGLPPFEDGHPLLGTPRGQLLFSGSWSVRLLRQGHNVAHTHPMGWISSAFYVSLPSAAQMGPAPAGWIRFGTPPPELGLDLPAYAQIEPRPGRLVLFPSTMWHSTLPFEDGERLVAAFDVRPPAY
jgi:tetratricopeptide (TPR) repeat protein